MDKINVYMVTDSDAISFLINDNLEEFKAHISSGNGMEMDEPMEFDTEAEAISFCAGLGYGKDEYYFPDVYPLRSCESSDLPYINTIENLA